MALTNEKMARLKEFQEWIGRVAHMDSFRMPTENFVEGARNKYERFTGFFQKWVEEHLRVRNDDDEGLVFDSDAAKKWNAASNNHGELPENWWNIALKVGAGKNVEANTLPQFDGEITNEGKDLVYETFMPAYRALKESFEKRSIFQWIFNHRQYTAERDTLKAIKGIIFTFTGEGEQGLKAKYDEHVKDLPVANAVDLYKMEKQESFDREQEKIRESTRQREKELEEEKQREEEFERQKIEEISQKEQINNKDQSTILLNDENFKSEVTKELKNMIPKKYQVMDVIFNAMIGKTLWAQTTPSLKTISEKVDRITGKEKIEEVEDKEDIAKEVTIKPEIRDIFKKAWTVINAFKMSEKDRVVLAQKITNHIVIKATAIGFDAANFAEYGKNYTLANDTDFVKELYGSTKTSEEVNNIIDEAKKELAIGEVFRENIHIEELAEVSKKIEGVEKVEYKGKDALVNEK